jgi:transposase
MTPEPYDLTELSLAQLGDLREWQLESLEKVTRALRNRVQAQSDEGMSVKALAKKAGVTRRTIYAWLNQ